MNPAETLVTSEKCGFFDILSTERFEIGDPNEEFDRIAGQSTAGMSYLDVVCPEDRERVSDILMDVFLQGGGSIGKVPRACGSIRHRIAQPDGMVVAVAFTFGRVMDGTLACSVIRVYETFSGDTLKKYKSNNVLESFAVSMAVIEISDELQFFVKYANTAFFRMIGWSRLEFQEMFSHSLNDDIVPSEDFAVFCDKLLAMDEEHPECLFETRVMSGGSEFRIYEVCARYLYAENKHPLITLVFVDVTEQKKLRRELLVRNERFNIIQAHSEQVIFDYDTETDRCVFTGNMSQFRKYMPAYERDILNGELAVDDFFARRFGLNIMSQEDYQKFCEVFADAIFFGLNGEVDFLLCFVGQTVGLWYKCAFSSVKDEMGTVIRIVGRLKNIDKQKKSEMMMEKRVYNDSLTGLLNKDTAMNQIRLFLEDETFSRCESGKLHALIVIDMDNFRRINEKFSHAFGDDVIREFASDIKSSFRDTDIVGRIGGDEFLILMKNVTKKFAVRKAGRLCRGLVKRYGEQNPVTVSCSIGVSFLGEDAHEFYELYQHADLAMYAAKMGGRGAYRLYDGTIDADYRRHDDVESLTDVESQGRDTTINDLDTNLMDIAFSLMNSSADKLGMLEILLRTVGRKYNLSSVSVLRCGEEKDRLTAVRRWLSAKNVPGRQKVSPMERGGVDLDRIFNGADIRWVSDMETSSLYAPLRGTLNDDGIKACVFGRMEGRSGETVGCVMFTQFDRRRKWSRKEINSFKYMAKILSVALTEQASSGQA